MSNVPLSYTAVLRAIFADDEAAGLANIVEQHKNWGAFPARLPSHIVVLLIDEIKSLKEAALGDLPEPEDFQE